MRLTFALLAAVLIASPVAAQQLSPLTGTTAAPPTTAPAAPSAAPPAASAAPARRGRMTQQQRFEASNTTHDGKLTLGQASAGHMTRVAKNFDAIDTSRKGYVTMDDIRAYNRAQRAARKAAR